MNSFNFIAKIVKKVSHVVLECECNEKTSGGLKIIIHCREQYFCIPAHRVIKLA